MVEGTTPNSAAACLMFIGSPGATSSFGTKHGIPVRAQARFPVAVEAQAARRSTALPIEDAGDDGVGIVLVQPRLMAKPSR
jgi:hypothetical protein